MIVLHNLSTYVYIGVLLCNHSEGLRRGWWSDRLVAWSDRPGWQRQGNPNSRHLTPTRKEPLMGRAKLHTGGGPGPMYL
jgi:hypothetical protein